MHRFYKRLINFLWFDGELDDPSLKMNLLRFKNGNIRWTRWTCWSFI